MWCRVRFDWRVSSRRRSIRKRTSAGFLGHSRVVGLAASHPRVHAGNEQQRGPADITRSGAICLAQLPSKCWNILLDCLPSASKHPRTTDTKTGVLLPIYFPSLNDMLESDERLVTFLCSNAFRGRAKAALQAGSLGFESPRFHDVFAHRLPRRPGLLTYGLAFVARHETING